MRPRTYAVISGAIKRRKVTAFLRHTQGFRAKNEQKYYFCKQKIAKSLKMLPYYSPTDLTDMTDLYF